MGGGGLVGGCRVGGGGGGQGGCERKIEVFVKIQKFKKKNIFLWGGGVGSGRGGGFGVWVGGSGWM